MLETVRISSKRQITIPARVFHWLGLGQGDQLVVEVKDQTMVLQKAQNLLDELAGSVKLPKRFKNKPIDLIIKSAKDDYFSLKR